MGILDIFEIANNYLKNQNKTEQSFFNVQLATVTGDPVQSFTAMPITPLSSIEEINHADMIIVPPVMNDIENALTENEALFPWMKSLHNRSTILVSICTGVFFLAETGLLNKKTVTTNPLLASYFLSRYPNVKTNLSQLFIDQGDIITAGPTYAFLDLIIYLVEKYCGLEAALFCSKLLLHDKNRSSQAPYFNCSHNQLHQDEEIQNIQLWLEEHCVEAVSIESIAERFHMSPRNLVRRFQNAVGDSPLSYIQTLRVELAKQKLETTQLRIEKITQDVGYEDSKSFGRLFKRHTSLSLTEYRKRFSARLN